MQYLNANFEKRVTSLVSSFITLGYNKKLIRNSFINMSRKYLFSEKFGEVRNLLTLFD